MPRPDMEFHIKHFLLYVTVIECLHPFCSAGTLPANWRDFIHPDVLMTLDNDQSRYDSDMVEGDISGIEQGRMPVQAAANAVNDISLMWPNNTIPYDFSLQRFATFGSFLTQALQMVEEAMELIMLHTAQCVKFVPRTAEEDYVRFQKSMQSFSNIGRTGGRQPISLSKGCLARYGCIQHEIMHTLGFYHEQSRMDRDDYVFINFDNIAENDQVQFEKHSAGLTYNLPYDYESVMHYELNAFAKDSLFPTILPKSGKPKVGQQENLSPLDVVRIHKRFKCGTAPAKAFFDIVQAKSRHITPSNNGSCEVHTSRRGPDNGTTIMLEPFPAFETSNITQKQCETYLAGAPLNGNCQLSFNLREQDCTAHSSQRITITCNKADALDFQRMTESMSTPPIRPFRLRITVLEEHGHHVTFDDLAPVRKQIVLLLYQCDKTPVRNATSHLSDLRLSNLLETWLVYCYDLDIKKADFWPMNKLRVIVLDHCTILQLQTDTFTDLPALRVLSLDHGYSYGYSSAFSVEVREYLQRLHCSCEFGWLRRWLQANNGITAVKNEGEMYALENSWRSDNWPKRDLYLPIDCASLPKDSGSIDFKINSFSVNEPICVV